MRRIFGFSFLAFLVILFTGCGIFGDNPVQEDPKGVIIIDAKTENMGNNVYKTSFILRNQGPTTYYRINSSAEVDGKPYRSAFSSEVKTATGYTDIKIDIGDRDHYAGYELYDWYHTVRTFIDEEWITTDYIREWELF